MNKYIFHLTKLAGEMKERLRPQKGTKKSKPLPKSSNPSKPKNVIKKEDNLVRSSKVRRAKR